MNKITLERRFSVISSLKILTINRLIYENIEVGVFGFGCRFGGGGDGSFSLCYTSTMVGTVR